MVEEPGVPEIRDKGFREIQIEQMTRNKKQLLEDPRSMRRVVGLETSFP